MIRLLCLFCFVGIDVGCMFVIVVSLSAFVCFSFSVDVCAYVCCCFVYVLCACLVVGLRGVFASVDYVMSLLFSSVR